MHLIVHPIKSSVKLNFPKKIEKNENVHVQLDGCRQNEVNEKCS